jgi:hypothetical protein
MKNWLIFLQLVLVSFTILLSATSVAEDEGVLNRLLAPGPLIGGHKDLEGSDCLKCHDAGKGIPDAKCLDCHKELKVFVTEKRGFHGLTKQTCIQCHSDHQGRNYESVKIEEKTFEHGKMTGYNLDGKHAEIKCQDCHKDKRKNKFLRPTDIRYFGKAKTCLSCHKKDDIHYFKGTYASKDCSACHGLKSWKEQLSFDHERDGKYKLEGKHKTTKCIDCHRPDKKKQIWLYKWPKLQAQKCLTCHQDQHQNKLSPKYRNGNCVECHSFQDWKLPKFDHEKVGYKLNFKHAETKCVDCHKQPAVAQNKKSEPKNFIWTGLKKACLSCHKDEHLFGPQKSLKLGDMNACGKCHDESGWKKIINFSHDQSTRYPLDGKHDELKCKDCHLPNPALFAREKDPGKKMQIPRPTRWGVYHWDKLDSKTCETCHLNPHLNQFKKEILAKKCSVCHTTEGWQMMKAGKGFDHSKTRFSLTGAHSTTRCAECHQVSGKQIFKFKSFEQKFCIDCHQNVHLKQFSDKFSAQSCAVCHSTKNFAERLEFDHNTTKYPLEAAHIKVKCVDCHKPTRERYSLVKPNINAKDIAAKKIAIKANYLFPQLNSRKCMTCHTDYHKGQLGNECQKCHTVKDWKKTLFDHNSMSRFPLVEKHVKVSCEKCHTGTKENVKYKPLAQLCVDCHKDVHKGSFGKQCQECHSVRDWRSTKDFHKNFTLSGVHYTLECAECHNDGRKLSGLSQQCISCHAKDDVHSGTQPNCRECHVQHFWEVTGFKHSMTRFPLRGAHRTLDCLECHYMGGIQAIYQGLNTQCQACHAADFTAAASIPAAATGHAAESTVSDCSRCHRNQFSFRNAN